MLHNAHGPSQVPDASIACHGTRVSVKKLIPGLIITLILILFVQTVAKTMSLFRTNNFLTENCKAAPMQDMFITKVANYFCLGNEPKYLIVNTGHRASSEEFCTERRRNNYAFFAVSEDTLCMYGCLHSKQQFRNFVWFLLVHIYSVRIITNS